ncbi:threonyl-tRNA synthetase editing domain-containing protein [Methanocella arvoryzae]|uniref:threonyl-tRNA synthetase editing domain-containing protein n=1 Tax=Methanocella arvoryzae TaxID=1175445 RepID=UPI0000DB201E|nr:threonyl-tRNA synthetase editing domain-containing protein [Methanocella arvoryzae]
MRILAIHADSMSYKANRKTKIAEEIEFREGSMEDCVVLLSSVEKLDEVNPPKVIEASVKEVLQRLEKLKAMRVMIFPFAHLTSTLSSPAVALQILNGMQAGLQDAGVEVKRAPFGWYKEYNIKSKGHPMAELSMTICPYEGHSCDFLCPYCENPIKLRDMSDIEAERSATAEAGNPARVSP